MTSTTKPRTTRYSLHSLFGYEPYVYEIKSGEKQQFGRLQVGLEDTRVSRSLFELRVGQDGTVIDLKNVSYRPVVVTRNLPVKEPDQWVQKDQEVSLLDGDIVHLARKTYPMKVCIERDEEEEKTAELTASGEGDEEKKDASEKNDFPLKAPGVAAEEKVYGIIRVQECGMCQFQTTRNVGQHQQKIHGKRKPFKVVDAPAKGKCGGCGALFLNEAGVVRHLVHSPECKSGAPSEAKVEKASLAVKRKRPEEPQISEADDGGGSEDESDREKKTNEPAKRAEGKKDEQLVQHILRAIEDVKECMVDVGHQMKTLNENQELLDKRMRRFTNVLATAWVSDEIKEQ